MGGACSYSLQDDPGGCSILCGLYGDVLWRGHGFWLLRPDPGI